MEFCTLCGTRLVSKSRSRAFLYCPKCGNESKLPEEKMKGNIVSSKPSDSGIAVLDRKALSLKSLPVINAYCQKGGGNKAVTWSIPRGPEGVTSITLYRCISWGYTWRETE
jgi:DNA-directed RNA polymerase subunit M/transcription elongation factor TFIIS